jgi:septum formation protein
MVLASASPRRADLLRAAGFTFETLAVDVDERVNSGEEPAAYVRRLAIEKAARALELMTQGVPAEARAGGGDVVILGADTAVVLDGEIFGKPQDVADAERMLRRLAGRRHDVVTGVSLRSGAPDRPVVEAFVERTVVEVAALMEADIAWYVASGEGIDKAGAYAIQGLASRFITRIEGSYANVVGLPVARVAAVLRRMEWPG